MPIAAGNTSLGLQKIHQVTSDKIPEGPLVIRPQNKVKRPYKKGKSDNEIVAALIFHLPASSAILTSVKFVAPNWTILFLRSSMKI